jgi:hypothetical protein
MLQATREATTDAVPGWTVWAARLVGIYEISSGYKHQPTQALEAPPSSVAALVAIGDGDQAREPPMDRAWRKLRHVRVVAGQPTSYTTAQPTAKSGG